MTPEQIRERIAELEATKEKYVREVQYNLGRLDGEIAALRTFLESSQDVTDSVAGGDIAKTEDPAE